MKKKVLSVCVGGLLCLGLAAVVSASPTKRYDPATKSCRFFTQQTLWKGYQGFRNFCKTCHYKGNDKGAKFLHTESKTMKGWNRVFSTRYPQCAKNGTWDKLQPQDLQFINDYLYKKAADTYDPYDAYDCG